MDRDQAGWKLAPMNTSGHKIMQEQEASTAPLSLDEQVVVL